MKKTILLYGLLGGVLIAALNSSSTASSSSNTRSRSTAASLRCIFSALGIWLGLKLTRADQWWSEVRSPSGDRALRAKRGAARALGITPRELEILEAMAAGLSNREIAERLFVSENTVKTHTGRLFDKLSANRRTQAVQTAKEAGLIP